MKNSSIHRWLYPVALLYGIAVRLRNYLYNKQILKSKSYPIPIICVGNLAVGGTGKTPMVEYLIRRLHTRYRLAVVSRGYKRQSKGLMVAQKHHGAAEIGDEPRQMLTNFPGITMVLDGNRCRAIEYLLALPQEERPEVILLDDGFQHRRVLPSLCILLTEWARPFIKDKLLPVGRLRETMEGALRADCIILTRCPREISPIEIRIMERNLSLYPHQKLLFSRTQSGALTPIFAEMEEEKNARETISEAIAMAGIAHPQPFFEEVGKRFRVLHTLHYADHHHFTDKDLDTFAALLREYPQATLVTTQKDAVRIIDHEAKLSSEIKKRLYYIPIETILPDEDTRQLDKIVEKTILHVQRSTSAHL